MTRTFREFQIFLPGKFSKTQERSKSPSNKKILDGCSFISFFQKITIYIISGVKSKKRIQFKSFLFIC